MQERTTPLLPIQKATSLRVLLRELAGDYRSTPTTHNAERIATFVKDNIDFLLLLIYRDPWTKE